MADQSIPLLTKTPQTSGLQMTQEVKVYLEGLLEDAGITPVDELMKEELLKEIYVRLDNYLATVILDNMPTEHLDTFIKMNEEKKSKEEMETFFKEKVPNYKEILTKAFADFRDLYLGNITAARNAPKN